MALQAGLVYVAIGDHVGVKQSVLGVEDHGAPVPRVAGCPDPLLSSPWPGNYLGRECDYRPTLQRGKRKVRVVKAVQGSREGSYSSTHYVLLGDRNPECMETGPVLHAD